MSTTTEAPEFKVGDIVTFKPYELTLKAKVKEVFLPGEHGNNDHVIYHLEADATVEEVMTEFGMRRKLISPVKTYTSGKCIVESKYYEPGID